MATCLRRLAALAAAFALHAAALAQDVRIVAQEGSTPKFIGATVDGKPQVVGLCVDVLRAIERIDPSLRFVGDQQWRPLIRAEADMAAGALDAACAIIRTPEREAKFDFVDTPLFVFQYLLAVRANDTVQVSNWEDVRKLGSQGVILTMHGFAGIMSHLRAVGGLRIDEGGRDTRVNLEKLLAGRGRFFIHRSPGIASEIAASGYGSKVRILPTVMHSESLYMMVSKSMPAALKDKLNRALMQLVASGELARISKRWEERI